MRESVNNLLQSKLCWFCSALYDTRRLQDLRVKDAVNVKQSGVLLQTIGRSGGIC